jgi:hypothetical protein
MITVGYAPDCGTACANKELNYYSNCTNITDGCYVYSDDSCDVCLPDTSATGEVMAGGNDNSCYEIIECQLETLERCEGSDIRLKNSIETIPNAVDKLLKIPVREFDWNSSYYYYDKYTQTGKIHSIGVIAQELLEVVPYVVHTDHNGYYWVDYTKLNGLLIEGVKEQQRSIYEINRQIEELEKLIQDGE